MKNKQYRRYYLLSCIGVLLASYYPLSMGIRVITNISFRTPRFVLLFSSEFF